MADHDRRSPDSDRLAHSRALLQKGTRAVERSRAQLDRAHASLTSSEGRLLDTELRRNRDDGHRD